MDIVLNAVEDAARALTAKDEARERVLVAVRPVLTSARAAINRVHAGELDQATSAYQEALKATHRVRDEAAGHEDLWTGGAVRNALQELAEAWALIALAGGTVAPLELGTDVTPDAIVLGAADAVGELRRLALDALIAGDVAGAQTRLDQMGAIYDALVPIDVAQGTAAVKHKVDVARQLVDRTRGAVALASIEGRLAVSAAQGQGPAPAPGDARDDTGPEAGDGAAADGHDDQDDQDERWMTHG